jgi:hypothetical protein
MSKINIVTAPQVAVTVEGAMRYLDKGSRVPDSVDSKHVKSLIGLGFVETVNVEDADLVEQASEESGARGKVVEIPDGVPTDDKSWTVDAYKAYAAREKIELGSAKTREELLAAVVKK